MSVLRLNISRSWANIYSWRLMLTPNRYCRTRKIIWLGFIKSSKHSLMFSSNAHAKTSPTTFCVRAQNAHCWLTTWRSVNRGLCVGVLHEMTNITINRRILSSTERDMDPIQVPEEPLMWRRYQNWKKCVFYFLSTWSLLRLC